MGRVELQYSKGAVTRAGERLAGGRATSQELLEATDVVQHFRSCHQYPLGKVAMGLRSMSQTVTGRLPVVGQRLKRFPQIVRKLQRHPGMQLARMQDIGGCRALVDNLGEQDQLFRRARRTWRVPANRIRNYVEVPQETGYRAIHLVTERDNRMIEVQIRTPGQQQWAMSVETVAGYTGWPLKDGDGPEDALDYYRTVGLVIALQEGGEPVPDELLDEVAERRRRTERLMKSVP